MKDKDTYILENLYEGNISKVNELYDTPKPKVDETAPDIAARTLSKYLRFEVGKNRYNNYYVEGLTARSGGIETKFYYSNLNEIIQILTILKNKNRLESLRYFSLDDFDKASISKALRPSE